MIISELRDHLGFRRMECGMRLLATEADTVMSIDPAVPGSGVLLGLLAQWVDAGYASPELIERLLARFPSECRPALHLQDYLHVRVAEGLVAMACEEFDSAIGHFKFVQSLQTDVDDSELLAICNFWTARCLRHGGRYEDALGYVVEARRLALSCGYGPMAAIMQALESWLAFQRGKLNEAQRLLQGAEEALGGTDDYVTRGNIQSAYGRIARRQGRFAEALESFNRAIAEYECRDPHHLHKARSLVNIAVVERLIALRQQKDLDRASARRRADASGSELPPLLAGRSSVHELRTSARAHLSEALTIYQRHGQIRGTGKVHINAGLLALDDGDLEGAAEEAGKAFAQAKEHEDRILLARVRLLQCSIEHARLEEEIGDDLAQHARLAADFARDAVEYAAQTQNPRLLARAYTWQGLSFTLEPILDLDAANRCCQQAFALLPDVLEREAGWDDLECLRSRASLARPIDPLLRAWSNGAVENRTFQQMTEEFARIVIPRVWEREDRKVARVARKLSISPKKVRRILITAGIHERHDD